MNGMFPDFSRRQMLGVGASSLVLGLIRPFASAAPKAAPPSGSPVPKQNSHMLAPRFGDGRDWWFERRFGMFVHWGLYAIHGWHEQEQWRLKVPRSEYEKLQARWNPSHFDPDSWLDLAEEAGMQYICLTTKHHDGFCLWDTKQTTYNSVNTPHGKDIVGLLANACHKRKFPLCLYYSIADWHHPNYPNQGRHHELPPQPGDSPDWDKYMEYLRAQIRELCTRYGEIHGIWWDMNVPKYQDPSIHAMIRQLQPNAVVNDRGFDPGDFGTPERDYTREGEALPVFTKRTEACQAVGRQSWGFRAEEDYYSDRHLIRSIDKYRARDANYLLNVGPAADGTIPPQAAAILRRIGKWYHACSASFATPAPDFTSNRDVLVTRDGNAFYIHLLQDPSVDAVELQPVTQLPRRSTLLNDGRSIPCSNALVPTNHTEGKGYLRLRELPVNEMANTVLVVKLEFDTAPDIRSGPLGTTDPNAIQAR